MYYEDAETQITEKMRLETARIPFEAVPQKQRDDRLSAAASL